MNLTETQYNRCIEFLATKCDCPQHKLGITNIQKLAEILQEPWHDASHGTPKQYESALICYDAGIVEEAQWDGSRWLLARTGGQNDSVWIDAETVTHWRELPSPPLVRP